MEYPRLVGAQELWLHGVVKTGRGSRAVAAWSIRLVGAQGLWLHGVSKTGRAVAAGH
jgi:hypothetical protein